MFGSLFTSSPSDFPASVDATSADLPFDFKRFFTGDVEGWGVFHGRNQHADQHFSAAMHTKWLSSDEAILNEDFIWSDGRKQERKWHITFEDTDRFTATADDIIGKAYGLIEDNALRMSYEMIVTRASGQKINLTFDDRLYRVSEKSIINKTLIKKFGIHIGSLSSAFVKAG
ncbi:MAG: DUF3833 family protein [Pseudomonadota bacterium]